MLKPSLLLPLIAVFCTLAVCGLEENHAYQHIGKPYTMRFFKNESCMICCPCDAGEYIKMSTKTKDICNGVGLPTLHSSSIKKQRPKTAKVKETTLKKSNKEKPRLSSDHHHHQSNFFAVIEKISKTRAWTGYLIIVAIWTLYILAVNFLYHLPKQVKEYKTMPPLKASQREISQEIETEVKVDSVLEDETIIPGQTSPRKSEEIKIENDATDELSKQGDTECKVTNASNADDSRLMLMRSGGDSVSSLLRCNRDSGEVTDINTQMIRIVDNVPAHKWRRFATGILHLNKLDINSIMGGLEKTTDHERILIIKMWLERQGVRGKDAVALLQDMLNEFEGCTGSLDHFVSSKTDEEWLELVCFSLGLTYDSVSEFLAANRKLTTHHKLEMMRLWSLQQDKTLVKKKLKRYEKAIEKYNSIKKNTRF